MTCHVIKKNLTGRPPDCLNSTTRPDKHDRLLFWYTLVKSDLSSIHMYTGLFKDTQNARPRLTSYPVYYVETTIQAKQALVSFIKSNN